MLKNKYLKYKLYYIILDLLLWTVVFCIFKILFLYIYSKTLQNCFDVIIHGLPLDISIASYLSTVPALILTITSWIKDNKSTNKKRKYYKFNSENMDYLFKYNCCYSISCKYCTI